MGPPTLEPPAAPRAPWADTVAVVASALDVDVAAGLSATEAARRLAEHGRNELVLTPPRPLIEILVAQFASVLVALLAAAAALSLLFGQWAEAIAVLAVLLLNAGIGFVTELRAVRSVESLRSLGTATTTVRRDGRLATVPLAEVVPGDVLVLNGGDLVPADARVSLAHTMQADESALTGESVPTDKSVAPVAPDAGIHARSSQLFRGTAIVRGSGEAVVTTTGMATELGKIAVMVDEAAPVATPLEQRLDSLGKSLVWVTLVVAVVVTASGVGSGKGWLVLLQTAIALAVATIPEGLPIISTLTLARGVNRMAQRNALVDRLAAVETLGATSVIFTDKTGTLTENRMTLVAMHLADGRWDAGEGSSAPFTRAEADGPEADAPGSGELESREPGSGEPGSGDPDTAGLHWALSVAALCTSADLGESSAVGDPLELAILAGARSAGIDRAALLVDYPELDVAAFDSDVMMMATLHGTPTGSFLLAVKGAPGPVIEACSAVATAGASDAVAAAGTADAGIANSAPQRHLSEGERHEWLLHNRALAEAGLRVLALAERRLATKPTAHADPIAGARADSRADSPPEPDDADPYRDLTLLGLIAFVDPPRADVRAAIAAARAAGIRVVMMTGDQAVTASAIAESVGIAEPGAEVLVGSRLSELFEGSDADRQRVLDTSILARVNPEQKLRLIEAHQARGAIVAMTGDGVNDAPALKRADIGVAMGLRGTDVAREAADMVLTDDAFATIVAAVREGRVIFDNIRAFVIYLLSCNLSEVLVIGLAATLGYPLPLLPLQILFINLVTDVLPALALGNGEGDGNVMKRAPRAHDEPLLARAHWRTIVGYAVLLTASVLAAFVYALEVMGLSEGQAVTVSFSALALAQVWHVFTMREPGTGLLRNTITRNGLVWLATAVCSAAIVLVNALPPLRSILHLEPLPADGWVLIAVAVAVPAVLGQIGKALGLGKVA